MNGAALGTLWLLATRSLRQHWLATLVTTVSTALAVGLTMAVFNIRTQTYEAFTGSDIGFDAVLGARGSQLQLVLNAVYHLETSPGNIPWRLYEEIRRDPNVQLAVPYALGDNYRGFRIVGTTGELFSKFAFRGGEGLRPAPGGRVFDPQYAEAVVGAFAAQKTGLRVGSTFNPYHGLTFNEAHRHEEEYVVVGVLEPTNTPSDRAIFIPIEGIYRMDGHVLRGTGEEYTAEAGVEVPPEHREVSAVLLKFTSPAVGMGLSQTINRQGTVATLAYPIGRVMAELFEKMGWMNRVLEVVAYLTMGVAGGTILASIHNTINERRRDFAIMRALGARRRMLFVSILGESMLTAAIGSLGGFVVQGIILAVASGILRAQTGIALDPLRFVPELATTPLLMIGVGAVAGLIPAFAAYRGEVAADLAPQS